MTRDQQIGVWVLVGFAAIVVVLMIVLFAFSSHSQTAPSNFVSTTVPAITSADNAKGPAQAKVTVIEYGDFECPACKAYEPIMQQLQSEYSTRVLFVFRNFPLYQIHPNAEIGAMAAEAAALQGKYWQMHDMLYDKQTDWVSVSPKDDTAKYFVPYAQAIGLDVSKFQSDIQSSAVAQKIQTDVASGNAAKVDHTPTFFINLQQIQNPSSYAQFKSAIDAALASSTAQ